MILRQHWFLICEYLRYVASISWRTCILGFRVKIRSLSWGCISCIKLWIRKKKKLMKKNRDINQIELIVITLLSKTVLAKGKINIVNNHSTIFIKSEVNDFLKHNCQVLSNSVVNLFCCWKYVVKIVLITYINVSSQFP